MMERGLIDDVPASLEPRRAQAIEQPPYQYSGLPPEVPVEPPPPEHRKFAEPRLSIDNDAMSFTGNGPHESIIEDLLATANAADRTVEHLSRSESVGPDSSGEEDTIGRRRPGRITTEEKKRLIELAATMCHHKWVVRGKGRFINELCEVWKKEHRRISEDAVTKFLDKEMRRRDDEVAADDTSGREIRHGSYFDHLDILREHTKGLEALQIENRGKRKKVLTAQQSAKQEAQRNLATSYNSKIPTIELPSSGESSDEGGGSVLDDMRSLTRDSGSSTPARSTRSNSTLRSAKKKQKRDRDAEQFALSNSIDHLARATFEGISHLTDAYSGSSGRNLAQLVENTQKETAERLEAMDKQLEERQKAADEKINRILAIVLSLAGAEEAAK